MEKGLAKIILLLIIIVVVIFSLPYINEYFSRIKDQRPTIKYKNDIITVENYYVSNLNPYAGSATTLEFYVSNNGDKEVNRAEVKFFDVPGFNITGLVCEGGVLKSETTCLFDLDSLDARRVSLNLRAPESIISPTPFTISYSVKYNYSGYRRAEIPIIDGIYKNVPSGKFTQTTPTYGPILLEFEPPVGGEVKEDGKVKKGYWVVGTRPFEVKINFKHIGSSTIGRVKETNISKGNLKLDLKDTLVITTDSEKMTCDFDEFNNFLISNKNVIVPGKLICNFRAKSMPQPETSSIIEAEFNYTYEYIRTETFVVLPLPKD